MSSKSPSKLQDNDQECPTKMYTVLLIVHFNFDNWTLWMRKKEVLRKWRCERHASHLQDGESYHFVTKEAFEAAIKEGKFLEHAHVHSNIYGTTFKAVQEVASSGRCCILDIDVQGARLVRLAYHVSVYSQHFTCQPLSHDWLPWKTMNWLPALLAQPFLSSLWLIHKTPSISCALYTDQKDW